MRFFSSGSTQEQLSQALTEVWTSSLIRRVIDRAKVAVLLLLLLLFSAALMLVVGVYFDDAEFGIAVSVGVFTLASFV